MTDDYRPIHKISAALDCTLAATGSSVLFYAPPRDLLATVSTTMLIPPVRSPRIDLLGRMSLGGIDMSGHSRVVKVVPSRAPIVSRQMPRAPGVEAMLVDGWVWAGARFERDQEPRWKWEQVLSAAYIEGEPPSYMGDVFVRTGPTDHPTVGVHRADDAGGHASKVDGVRWRSIWHDGSKYQGQYGRRVADLAGGYSGSIDSRRVESGRYADRLPTNRRRKREAAKARRRARLR